MARTTDKTEPRTTSFYDDSGVNPLGECPECGALTEGAACLECGLALSIRPALLTIVMDRLTDKDLVGIERCVATWEKGRFDEENLTIYIQTPDEFGELRAACSRMLKRKGTTILGPTGRIFDADDPILECLATRKTSKLRTCMTQGMGESYCNQIASLLSMAEGPGNFSLEDGLEERDGELAGVALAAVLTELMRQSGSPVVCPMFSSALAGIPRDQGILGVLADKRIQAQLKLGIIPVPDEIEDQSGWTRVELTGVVDNRLKSLGEVLSPPLHPSWAAGIDDAVLAAQEETFGVLSLEQSGRDWSLALERHAGDEILVIPSRWHLFWARFNKSRKSEDVATWIIPGVEGITLRQMTSHLHGLASFGSIPIGPRVMVMLSNQRMVVRWMDSPDRPPIFISRDDISGDHWKVFPLGEEEILLFSEQGDVLYASSMVMWRISPSRGVERWPVEPWYTCMFDSTLAMSVLEKGAAVLSSRGFRLSFVQPAKKAPPSAEFLDIHPELDIRAEFLLTRSAGSIGSDRQGRVYLAGKGWIGLIDPAKKEISTRNLADGEAAVAMENGGWLVTDHGGHRRLLSGEPMAAEDFGEGLTEYLTRLQAFAEESSTLRARRNSMVENYYSLLRRRTRQRGGR